MDKERLAGIVRHLFSAGGPGLAILTLYMTKWGVPAEQQSWVFDAIAWALGAGGPIVAMIWSWIAKSVRSRILSARSIKGVEVHVDTTGLETPAGAKELAFDASVAGVKPMR